VAATLIAQQRVRLSDDLTALLPALATLVLAAATLTDLRTKVIVRLHASPSAPRTACETHASIRTARRCGGARDGAIGKTHEASASASASPSVLARRCSQPPPTIGHADEQHRQCTARPLRKRATRHRSVAPQAGHGCSGRTGIRERAASATGSAVLTPPAS
jgi:hypothetical protein